MTLKIKSKEFNRDNIFGQIVKLIPNKYRLVAGVDFDHCGNELTGQKVKYCRRCTSEQIKKCENKYNKK